MSIVDLLVTIVVVTILVTIVLAIVTYVAYKLRLSREPAKAEEAGGLQYFIEFRPPRLDPEPLTEVSRTHGHATQA